MRFALPFPTLRYIVRYIQHCGVFTACAVILLQACTHDTLPRWQAPITLPDDVRPFLDLRGAWSVVNTSEAFNISKQALPTTITVPSNWYNEGCDFAGTLTLERRFMMPSRGIDSLLRLVFEGVDYEAEVFLNGKLLGKHTGYFQPFSFDMSGAVLWGKENVLRVRVSSPNERSEDWSLRKRLIKGIFGHHDTRPGGAWSERGQEQNTGGIWGNTYILSSEGVHIENVGITPHLSNVRLVGENLTEKDSVQIARIALKSVIWSNVPRKVLIAYSSTLIGSDNGETVKKVHFLQAGQNLIVDTLTIVRPALWHTYDVGMPHRYSLRTEISVVSSHDWNGEITPETFGKYTFHEVASRTDKFGIRTIRYDTASGAWYLNGKRLFLRGTNYIGTQFLSTMSRTEYDRDAALMRSANINAVRVHAHIARKEWYDACDKAGILVWQDFPLQWGYSDDAEVVQSASNQARDMVSLLGNHPSVAAWCMQNEPPFDADWMKYKYPTYHPLQNRSLNFILTRIARNLDSTRYVHPFSATREHRWEGWYFGAWTDYAKPTLERLVTEFGAQALPNLETMQMIPGIAAEIPKSDSAWAAWEYHNFQKHETFDFARVQTGNNIEDFVRNSQGHQAKVTELAAESYRLQRYSPVGAVFQFMFVEAWASMNWGVVDYLRRPKAGYYALSEVYQPVFIAARLDTLQGKVHICCINDQWRALNNLQFECALETPNHAPLLHRTDISLAADTLQHIHSFSLPSQGIYTLRASLRIGTGDTVSKRQKTIVFRSPISLTK
ncbi:MAG: glycoside hydrolase family 2 [Candidatus Kapabacteria bacterium]|jgi:beta-mannosidase|nr:glycoside hydrolase family 2 [Candidatus Kapabacteria bacterium]